MKKYLRRPGTYLPFTLFGTTFSGDPMTTLGNTLRSIFYIQYYLRNIDAKRYLLAVAGDDVMIICAREDSREIRDLVKNSTARNNGEVSTCGQVVKKVDITSLDGAEFCSKWFFYDGTLSATRDYKKTLHTRQFYNRENATLLRTPALHRLAIL